MEGEDGGGGVGWGGVGWGWRERIISNYESYRYR